MLLPFDAEMDLRLLDAAVAPLIGDAACAAMVRRATEIENDVEEAKPEQKTLSTRTFHMEGWTRRREVDNHANMSSYSVARTCM